MPMAQGRAKEEEDKLAISLVYKIIKNNNTNTLTINPTDLFNRVQELAIQKSNKIPDSNVIAFMRRLNRLKNSHVIYFESKSQREIIIKLE